MAECIQTDSIYALTATTPAEIISLRFDVAGNDQGFYRIRSLAGQPQREGHVEEVTVPDSDDNRYWMLRGFAHRFVVITLASIHGSKLLWLVGLTHCNSLAQDEAPI